MTVRVVACQQPLHEPLSSETISRIQDAGVAFVALPEHYPIGEEVKTLQGAAALYALRKKYLQDLSLQLNTTVVGGTLTETTSDGYYNTCYLFERGVEIGYYRKVHPTQREQEAGVIRGDEFRVFEVGGFRIGVLICADVLSVRSFHQLASLRCQLVFVPTASPLRPGESREEKYERDTSIFLEGARTLGCPLVKTCGVGRIFGHSLQGRSLIATPERIVVRAEPHQEDQALLLFADLEI